MSTGLKFCIADKQSDGRGSLTHKAVITRITKGKGYIYTYGWFMLRFDRKQQNSVKQLSFNKKNNKLTFLKKE